MNAKHRASVVARLWILNCRVQGTFAVLNEAYLFVHKTDKPHKFSLRNFISCWGLANLTCLLQRYILMRTQKCLALFFASTTHWNIVAVYGLVSREQALNLTEVKEVSRADFFWKKKAGTLKPFARHKITINT